MSPSTPNLSRRRTHLPGLDTVRFLLALNVLLVHVSSAALFNPGFRPTAFFVLSGYVIAYRLLREQQTGPIDGKAFYIRRARRILPLYYVVAIVGGLALPLAGLPAPSPAALLSVLLMAPQLMQAYDWPSGLLRPLWSIGVEMAFYLVFPVLIRRFACPRVCLGLITASTALSAIAYALDSPLLPLLRVMRVECLAVGAVVAWLVVRRSRWLVVVHHRAVEAAAIGGVMAGSILPITLPLADLILSLIVAAFLVNLSTNPQPLIRLEWRWSRTAGQLSYGLYLWHVPVFALLRPVMTGIPLLLATLGAALLVAWLTYELVERPCMQTPLSQHQLTRRDRAFAPMKHLW